jgi:ATP-dependent Clp protease ATP-binding subunit ClpB
MECRCSGSVMGSRISPSRDKCGGHRLAATGEFEERLEAVVREASCGTALRSLGEEWEPKPILFIDEIHLLLGAGSASGMMDTENILKPALARGAIRVIGATTIWNCSGVSMSVADFHAKAECRGRSGKSPAVIDAPLHSIEKDGALERRFLAVRIEVPSADEAVAILLALFSGAVDRNSPSHSGPGVGMTSAHQGPAVILL